MRLHWLHGTLRQSLHDMSIFYRHTIDLRTSLLGQLDTFMDHDVRLGNQANRKNYAELHAIIMPGRKVLRSLGRPTYQFCPWPPAYFTRDRSVWSSIDT